MRRGQAARHVDDVVVFVGGSPVTPFAERLGALLPAAAWAIAADAGLHVAAALDYEVHLVVGDMDSVDPVLLDAHAARGTAVERHPVDKDRTDLEIALDHARSLSPRRITVVGGGGGRLDHFVANLSQLAHPDLDGIDVVAHMPPAIVQVVTDEITMHGKRGELVSLIPVHGHAGGVTTTGLAFPLSDDDLPSGASRGVSNRFEEPLATVAVRTGRLLVIRPGVA
jgi:thiamine pyrophosphokinase